MIADIAKDGFLDERYLDEDIPDEFFQEYSVAFREHPAVVVYKQPIVLGETVSSVFMKADFEKDIMNCGPREGSQFNYIIEHDIGNVDPVFDWYEQFEKGNNQKFPFFLPSMPVFPPKALKEIKYFRIQKIMMGKGFKLINPSYSEINNCSEHGDMFSEVPKTQYDRDIRFMSDDSKCFFPYKDFRKIFSNKQIGMQFNPFHPRSYKFIKNMFQVDKVFRGVYVWNNEEHMFEFDFDDDRYRVHSDVWMKEWIGFSDYFAECFDFVGNYDFISDVLYRVEIDNYLREDAEFRVKEDYDIKPIFVEPYTTTKIPLGQYSAIGPWDGTIKLGLSDVFHVPYITMLFRSNSYFKGEEPERYIDITHLTKCYNNSIISIRKHCNICWCYKKYGMDYKCECDDGLRRIDKSRTMSQGDGYYVRDFGKEYKIYKKEFYGDLIFFRFKGKLPGAPTDGVDSLVYPYTMMTAMAMMQVGKKEKLGEIYQLSQYRDIEVDTTEITTTLDEQNSVPELTSEELQKLGFTEEDKELEITDIKNDKVLRAFTDYLQREDVYFNLKKGKVIVTASKYKVDQVESFYNQLKKDPKYIIK